MRTRLYFQKIFCVVALMITASPALAQTSSSPRQERLLNGLKVLIWSDPSSDNVSIKIRIHSGTAFDPQGKEGVMALLADSFFPTEASQEFFRQDLGGSLEVTANYDYIQIDATAKADEFLTLLEAVSTAISNPTIDKETTPRLVARRLERLKQLEADPSYVADRAVAKRLFGKFPYGRPELGTTESVAKLTFADVLDVKQRFLASDNATVAMSGKIDQALAYRAARRYLGSWLKSDRLPPATFEQPAAPDTTMALMATGVEGPAHTRFAFRGVARNEKDYPASEVLARVLFNRLAQNTNGAKSFVTNAAHILPGFIVLGMEGVAESTSLPTLLLSKEISDAEFAAARIEVMAVDSRVPIERRWLNADTYKLASVAADQSAFNAVTLADVRALAQRLSRNPVAAVTVSKGDKPVTAN